jgi:hypothetical protein
MSALETLIKAGAATGAGYGPAPCRRSNRGNMVATSYITLSKIGYGTNSQFSVNRTPAMLRTRRK